MRIEESLNVTFDESLPEPKSSPSVEDDRINKPLVQDFKGSPSLQINVSDEGYTKSSYLPLQRYQPSKYKSIDQAKNRWAIEGDENSKYFHGIINKKRSQLAIRGVLVEGDWIVEPSHVKKEFLNHFSNRFADPNSPKLCIDFQFPNTLSLDQLSDIERDVTYDEIKKAVWDCGTNKSPSPDDFTFEFFRRYWKIIDDDVVAAVFQFFSSGTFLPGCNSSFIALIPKMQEAKVVKDFRPISLIGSVYKIVATILAKSSSLVISSLISDVQSAFVSNRQILDGPFILNELLSWCKHKKSKAMIFKVDFEKAFDSGIPINDSLILSHLFYADDVVFVGKWDKMNVATIVNVLKCFFLASGLKINLIKSKLMGIGIPHEYVLSTTESIGCSILTVPFSFLGVKVVDIMSRRSFWEETIDKKLTLIGWKNILASKKNGGLGVSSFYALNLGNGKGTSFWEDRWLSDLPLKHLYPRVFRLKLEKHVTVASKLMDMSLISSFRRSPRGGIKKDQFRLLRASVSHILLPQINDRWVCLESSGDFSVKFWLACLLRQVADKVISFFARC
ncbi:RNA-directed DNA polymerase, eukaryota [Tanacetum coccineum]